MSDKILKRHAEMVFDLRRTIPLLRAIRRTIRKGDIVVDLGCGIGILSFAAAHAGAKRVYAMDVDGASLELARWQSKKLGFERKICFFEDYSYNVDLMEKADVLIQETVGRIAFDENFLPALCDAKKRFLKPNGKIIPAEVSLHAALVDKNEGWLSGEKIVAKITSRKAKQDSLHGSIAFSVRKSGSMDGILLWPKVVWGKGLVTNSHPHKPLTHWRQTLLGRGAIRVDKGDQIIFDFQIGPHPADPHSSSKMDWRLTK